MTTYTSNELATRVLKDLGLLDASEAPSAADLDWAEETCTAEISMLAALGIPIWNGSEVSVPQEYLTILSRRIGLALAPSFGLTDLATAQLAMREAERSLTMLASPRGLTPLSLRSDDFKSSRYGGFNFTSGR